MRKISMEDVGKVTEFLFANPARKMTSKVLPVDSGYNIVELRIRPACVQGG